MVWTRASKTRPSAAAVRKSASGMLPGFTSLATARTAATTVARLAGAPRTAFSTPAACSTRHLCSVPALRVSNQRQPMASLQMDVLPQHGPLVEQILRREQSLATCNRCLLGSIQSCSSPCTSHCTSCSHTLPLQLHRRTPNDPRLVHAMCKHCRSLCQTNHLHALRGSQGRCWHS